MRAAATGRLLPVLVACVLGCATAAAGDPPPAAAWPTDLPGALARARTSGKLVLVYLSEPPAT